ncbi:ATP-binding protein [Flavobacteriaceae bacterium F08102]|nr:ATP-binding protein [Flavobacteriaceae bacterium F08102]
MEEKLRQEDVNIVKIVLFGPESTGKTTLSRQLARHYNTVWVPEYARTYLQKKWNETRKTCENKDLVPIGIGQIKSENELAKKADKLLVCDTDLLETCVYSQAYYDGYVEQTLQEAALKNTYDLYFLTYIDTPWEADDLRDRPNEREKMFSLFEKALIKHNRPYILLKGNKKERLEQAITAIDNILSQRPNLNIFSADLIDFDLHFLHQNADHNFGLD